MTDEANSYPGERLGRPRQGPGSIARFGRRLAGLAVDLVLAAIIGFAFFPVWDPELGMRFASPLATNLVFVAMHLVFIPTIGGTPGHRILGMRLELLRGGWVGLWRPIVRTALLVLVIPALVFDSDQRGLHDKAAGTVLVRA